MVEVWGKKGNALGEFDSPQGITVGARGDIYILDTGNNRVQVMNTCGSFIRQWGKTGVGDGEFQCPYGIEIGKYQVDLRWTPALMVSTTLPPDLVSVCVVYLEEEVVYVVDTFNHRLQSFTMDGAFIGKWGQRGKEEGNFQYPMSCVAVMEAVYVADTVNSRIQVFHWVGGILRFAQILDTHGLYFSPHCMVSARNGTIYVVNKSYPHPSGKIIKVTESEAVSFHPQHQQMETSIRPLGMAVAKNGFVYVSEMTSPFIKMYKSDGTLVRRLCVSPLGAHALALDPQNTRLYVIVNKDYIAVVSLLDADA